MFNESWRDRTSPEYAVCRTLWKLPNKYLSVLDKRFLLQIPLDKFISKLSDEHPYLDYFNHDNENWEVSYSHCSQSVLENSYKHNPETPLLISMRARKSPYFRIALVTLFLPTSSVDYE